MSIWIHFFCQQKSWILWLGVKTFVLLHFQRTKRLQPFCVLDWKVEENFVVRKVCSTMKLLIRYYCYKMDLYFFISMQVIELIPNIWSISINALIPLSSLFCKLFYSYILQQVMEDIGDIKVQMSSLIIGEFFLDYFREKNDQ